MTRMVMSKIFKDMIRTVCQSFRIGTMRGALAVAARFSERPDENALKATLEKLLHDKGSRVGKSGQLRARLNFHCPRKSAYAAAIAGSKSV